MSRTRLGAPCWVVDFESADLDHRWQHHASARAAELERDGVVSAAFRHFEHDQATAVAAAGVRQRPTVCVEVRCDSCDTAVVHVAADGTPASERHGWSSDDSGCDRCPACPSTVGPVHGQLSIDDVLGMPARVPTVAAEGSL